MFGAVIRVTLAVSKTCKYHVLLLVLEDKFVIRIHNVTWFIFVSEHHILA